MCRKCLSSLRCRSELIDSAWVVIVPGQEKCIKKLYINDLNILITNVVLEKKLQILGFAKSCDSINRNEIIDSPNNEIMNRKISNARITESKYTNEPINLFQIKKKLN